MSPLPTHPIERVRQLATSRRYLLTATALFHASARGLSEADVIACVRGLTLEDVRKTMPSHRFPGRMQDVYKPWFRGGQWYVKVQVVAARDGELVVIISFKDA